MREVEIVCLTPKDAKGPWVHALESKESVDLLQIIVEPVDLPEHYSWVDIRIRGENEKQIVEGSDLSFNRWLWQPGRQLWIPLNARVTQVSFRAQANVEGAELRLRVQLG